MSEKITCIIAARNAKASICDAVLSAINAGVDEVFIFDDASTDDTDFRLESIRLKHPKSIYVFSWGQSIRVGPGVARNMLIEEVEGGLIIPLDADDQLKSISHLVEAYEPGVWVYGDHTEWANMMPQTRLGAPPASLSRKNITGVTFLFHRNDWLRAGGYDVDFPICEDYAFQCALTHAGIKPKYAPGVVYERFLHPLGNERTTKAGNYWSFYHQMAIMKYPSLFGQNR